MEKKFVITLHPNIIKDKFHYPIMFYNVELWGSWNDWSFGTPASLEYEMSRIHSGRWVQTINFNSKIVLDKGKYEYKWKFTYNNKNNNGNDILREHVVWLNDGLNILTNKHGWNQNNMFEYK